MRQEAAVVRPVMLGRFEGFLCLGRRWPGEGGRARSHLSPELQASVVLASRLST